MAIKHFALSVAATLSLGAIGSQAGATTIDFQDVSSGNCNYSGTSLASQGYAFTGNAADPALFVCNSGVVAGNTTAGLINANQTSILTFAAVGGDPFSFQSFFAGSRTEDFDASKESSTYGTATGLDIVGQLYGGGTVMTTVTFSGLTFEQFLLPNSFLNLTSVTLTALGNSRYVGPEFLIDDLVVNEPINSAVPEPSSWAMMLLGFGAIGCALRRRAKFVQGLPRVA